MMMMMMMMMMMERGTHLIMLSTAHALPRHNFQPPSWSPSREPLARARTQSKKEGKRACLFYFLGTMGILSFVSTFVSNVLWISIDVMCVLICVP
jgi:hypothetical protein